MEKEEDIGYIAILITGISLIILSFIYSYFKLTRFKNCYDNDFKFPYCEKYKNY